MAQKRKLENRNMDRYEFIIKYCEKKCIITAKTHVRLPPKFCLMSLQQTSQAPCDLVVKTPSMRE